MRALKITVAIVLVGILLMFTPFMLNDVLNPFCDHKLLSFISWGIVFLPTVAMVHAILPRQATTENGRRALDR